MDEGTDARDILENRVLPLRRGNYCMEFFMCSVNFTPHSLESWHQTDYFEL